MSQEWNNTIVGRLSWTWTMFYCSGLGSQATCTCNQDNCALLSCFLTQLDFRVLQAGGMVYQLSNVIPDLMCLVQNTDRSEQLKIDVLQAA